MSSCLVCGAEPREAFRRWDHRFVRCPSCGLEAIDPQPDDATLARIYGEQYYDAWGVKEDEELVREMKRATFLPYLRPLGKPRPGDRLLDCGAAMGYLAEAASEKGWDAYAVELSEFGARACARRLGEDHVFRGEAGESRFVANPAGRFEAITMIDFIEHVRRPREVIRWAAGRLAPGGRLLLVTPRSGGMTHRVMGRSWPHYKLEHLWYLRPGNLFRLLEEEGFEDLRLRPAPKALMGAYVATYFRRYRNPLLTPLSGWSVRLLPRPLTRFPIPLVLGDMLVCGRRRQGERAT